MDEAEKKSEVVAPRPVTEDGVPEAELANLLEVRRATLRQLRTTQLEEGLDWKIVDRAVVITPGGVEKVGTLLQTMNDDAGTAVTSEESGTVAKKIGGQVGIFDLPPERLWKALTRGPMTEVRIRRTTRNPRILEGEVLGNGTPRLVRVRLKPSKLWRPGMRLPCVCLATDFFEYLGRPPKSWTRWQ